jgi:hypothetical protein
MSEDRRDELLRQDWSDAWDELPEAPPLVPGPKTAQITLRLSPSLLERIRRVAELGSLPYHVLARSWLVQAIQSEDAAAAESDPGPHTAQLNIKLDEHVVDALKARADQLRRPYHRLARDWIATAVAQEEERLGLDPLNGRQPATVNSREAVSPYATGGGGVTLERRVAALYLAMMLTGDTAPELGPDREIRSVAFQQAPRIPLDDLVIAAASPEEQEPELELAIAVRRKPNIVKSDNEARTLFVEYLRTLLTTPSEEPERKFGLAVSGTQPHAQQLAELAEHAKTQMDAPGFFSLLKTPKKFDKALRMRLDHVEELVRLALPDLGISISDDSEVESYVWQLLRRLVVLMPRLEPPDTADWDSARRHLRHVARGGAVLTAGQLLDRLEVLAAQYSPRAAAVDQTMLRRDVHALLEDTRSRTSAAWQLLEQLQHQARAGVRDHVGFGRGDAQLHLDRTSEAQAVIAAAQNADALIVSGESGVGKSALVLDAIASAEKASKGEMQLVWLNLRQLPERSFELTSQLGYPLERVLSDLSAPHRYLVIDAADAAAEAHDQIFTALVTAARSSDVRLIAITRTDARQVVVDLLAASRSDTTVPEHVVPGLDDSQLERLAERFPNLRRLVADANARVLLRRLVVVDLLVRSDTPELTITDADAMRQIWERLVRNNERRDRGLPDARDLVMMQLALRELSRGSASGVASTLDAAAIDGLRRDGLLRTSPENPWQLLPDFAHDEIRRYAVARALLAEGDPATALLQAGAPRWALSAGLLACQTLLSQPRDATPAIHGRLQRLQEGFDDLAAQYGARWADLPSEALMTVADPRPLLADAWSDLRSDRAGGFQRLVRVVNQRHRDTSGTLDPVVVEPLVALLLEETTPWRESEEAATLLRDWLLALMLRDTGVGHPLRECLRERLAAAVAVADEQLRAELDAAAAAFAARDPNEVEQDRKRVEMHDLLFSGRGSQRRRRRDRPRVPRALTDETVLELLALLGPDLTESGEQLLRRVASDAPWQLAPAIEELGTGRALASYGRGLLATLVAAYYIDEDEDGSSFLEDGVRRHHWRGPVAPLAAWYRGPFGALFQSDLRGGVKVLNRLLNHAAQARARTLASLGDPWGRAPEDAVPTHSVELAITGTPRTYVGDSHVWLWYRGTGVGPYPCMSALQALERMCDQLVAAEVPLDMLMPILLEDCENLAMPGFVVGLLVRHIERAGTLLDPFLTEPLAWQLEFARVTSESTGLAASSDGVTHPERRAWSLREAAMWLTVHADHQRAEELRTVGAQLVTRALDLSREPEQDAADDHDSHENSESVAVIRAWASTLDQSSYTAEADEDRIVLQVVPPQEVQAALEPDNEDLRRGQEAIRIQMRYFRATDLRRNEDTPPTEAELAQDLTTAQELVADPPVRSAVSTPQMAAAIAAYAIEKWVEGTAELDQGARKFAVDVLLEVAEAVAPPDPFEFEGSFFEMGADRAAARALPCLLVPVAAPLRKLAASRPKRATARVLAAGRRLAQATAMETRLFLARGLDIVWRTPCEGESDCHHKRGFELAIESMRDCVFGEWDGGRRQLKTLPDPVVESLVAVPGEDIFVTKLDAAIRALGVAAVSDTCVAVEARQLLIGLLRAQQRGLLAHEENYDERGSHALIAARALLGLAAAGDEQPLRDHIAAYADRAYYLSSLLRAFSAAAEENTAAAKKAHQLWPSIILQVLELNTSGHRTFSDHHWGDWALAALAPTPPSEIEFLYPEPAKPPIAWRDPLGWETALDAWVAVAAGEPMCIDSFIRLVRELPREQQISFGLPRVARLAEGDINAASARSFYLTEWLKELRASPLDGESQTAWQRLVDGLVVAGNRTLAPYSR